MARVAAGLLLIDNLRSWQRHVCRVRCRAHDDGRRSGDEEFYADHLASSFFRGHACGQASLNEAKGVRKLLNAP
jgi:hypothetical protein